MQNVYTVKKCAAKSPLYIRVDGSKSITNRALMLAALSEGRCRIEGALFSEDTEAFLGCLSSLGFALSADKNGKSVTVCGTGGLIPNRKAVLDVKKFRYGGKIPHCVYCVLRRGIYF